MPDRGRKWTPAGQHPLRHGLAFVLSGGTAFAVDATVLELLTALLGVPAIAARVAAIALAMVAGWLMHRTFTFAVARRPNVAEFVRYAGVAWGAAAVNYAVFVLILLARPGTHPLVGLVVSSIAAMILAYVGMRFAAFHRSGARER
ncbi:MAG TPA: GtrA family protein [Hyphomicrobiaceae bacterium]|nr:GtrA family protein [Hyphomicrobiaceae bacterium]